MFEGTKYKLKETRFFFNKMHKNIKRSERFRFYIDAFLSAAYGTLEALAKEGKNLNRSKFKKMFDEKIKKLTKDHILIKRVRNSSQHQGNLPIKEKRLAEKKTGETSGLRKIECNVFSLAGNPVYLNLIPHFIVEGALMRIKISENVELHLPEMELVGDQRDLSSFEMERNLNWSFEFDYNDSATVWGACRSYLVSIEALVAKALEEYGDNY